ncbi:MAG: ATP-binding protein [Thermoplasmata archaeon]
MKIAVASGKGGTGKTTVAINLALSLGDCTLVDCDVEEPNTNVFLNIELEQVEELNLPVPKIDKEKCTLCGKCSEFCQYNALVTLPKEVLLFPELCHGCGGCSLVCEDGAISEQQRPIGVINKGARKGITYLQGLLNIGEPMATPLIAALKDKIQDDNLVILDSPPGCACSFIETVRDCDHCILVTEPTPFGLYDLKLAVAVVRDLKIPLSVVINKDGVGNDRVERYCEDEGIRIVMKIPYDTEIAKLYSQGTPFVLEKKEWKNKFRELVEVLKI